MRSTSRRDFLASAGLAVGASALASCGGRDRSPASAAVALPPEADSTDRWARVRQEFRLSDELVHMSALLVSSHPLRVREAIEQYRREIDEDPVITLQEHNRARQAAALEAAARYLGVSADEMALTDSTTMGIGLVYNGLDLHAGDEILTTDQDYYVTREAVRQASERSGATVRRISLYEDESDPLQQLTGARLVETIRTAIRPETRVLALTWVHSSTGLKLPLAAIGEAVADVNAGRSDRDRVIVVIDGVHGFGIEDIELSQLGIDVFAAGCHKWLFGPRGTGIVWANEEAWARMHPSIPSFIDDGTWEAWIAGNGDPPGPTTATRMTPGGFKAFEHQWALPPAFEFHEELGKAEVARRTHDLARQLKEGLADMTHVRLVTPIDASLSSGIVSFDVTGSSPWDVVRQLRERHRLVATVTPYAVRHVRLTPSIRNTPAEIDHAIEAVRALA